jgi:hypothetical protein
MWLMGVGLKAAAASLFLLDYTFRAGPGAFVLFAASDGALALVTLCALMRRDFKREPLPPRAASGGV